MRRHSDGVLFRNLGVGIYSRAGINYVRNSRFENSSVCDMVFGDYAFFSSVHRVSSVGSHQFISASNNGINMPPFGPMYGAASIRLEDCHVSQWSGWTAVDVDGILQVIDSTFTTPLANFTGGASAVSKQATCNGTDGSCPGKGCRNGTTNPSYNHAARSCGFPALFSNSTVSPGSNLLNATHGWRPIPGTAIQPDVVIASTGRCPATGITADTNFFRSTWPTPGKVIDASDPKFGLTGIPTWAHGTSGDYCE